MFYFTLAYCHLSFFTLTYLRIVLLHRDSPLPLWLQVQHFFKERAQQPGAALAMRSYFIRSMPEGHVTCRSDVKPGTFQARDNVSNFISWCRSLGIPDVLRFETDDLVLRKNEKNVILCLLELARVGAKLGMLAPTIVQMEQEIDEELESGEPPPQIKTCDMKSLDELVSWGLGGRAVCSLARLLLFTVDFVVLGCCGGGGGSGGGYGVVVSAVKVRFVVVCQSIVCLKQTF